jgi:hypothetical protein
VTAPRLNSVTFWLGGLVFAASLACFTIGFVRSPVIDDVLAQKRTVINKHARSDKVDLIRETLFAEAYWNRNPDVAAGSFFGADGALGVLGAREHYDRHGRMEGRHWGR